MTFRDIRELKQTAARREQSAPQAKSILLVYGGITVALSALVTVVNYCLGLEISQTGGLSNIGIRSILSTIQTILPMVQSVILMCLELGYLSATLRISREQYASPNSLRMGLDRFWPLLRCSIIQGLMYIGVIMVSSYLAIQIFMITPWSDAAISLATEYMGNVEAAMLMDEAVYMAFYDAMLPLFPIFGIILMLFIVPLFYQLRMVNYLLIDNPRYGAMMLLRQSKILMKRNRLQLFKLDLSFWWFYLLMTLAQVVAYGDALLPMVGVTLPWSDTVSYFLFYGIYLILQFGLIWVFLNRIRVTYALFYNRLLPEKGPENGVVLGNIFQM